MLVSPITPMIFFGQPCNAPSATVNCTKTSAESNDDLGEIGDYSVRFRKTRLCHFFPRCGKGKSCPFAHGDQEKRACPDLTKTKLCVAWREGTCNKPSFACKYAHGMEELRGSEDYHTAMQDVTPPPSPGMEAWTITELLLEELRPKESLPEATELMSDKEVQSSPTASLAQGGQLLEKEVSTDIMRHEALAPILASWLADIKKLVSYIKVALADVEHAEHGKEHLQEGLPTPEECRLALVMCMPDHYED